MLKKYLKYLQDNPNRYWFKAKLYGWGWVPVRWQGWVVICVFIAFIVYSGFGLEGSTEPTTSQLAMFFIKVALAVILMIIICYKTGEKPRWQWGPPKK